MEIEILEMYPLTGDENVNDADGKIVLDAVKVDYLAKHNELTQTTGSYIWYWDRYAKNKSELITEIRAAIKNAIQG
jgi:hypothetical protein